MADNCCCDTANLVALAQAGIQAHVANRRSRMNLVRSKGIFPPEDFAYDGESDTFTCPAGKQLSRHHFHARRFHWEYRTKRGDCAACPLRSQRTRDKSGRTLKRHLHQELLEQARAQSHSEAATMHGFKRARWRGLEKQSIQDLLIATIQNLKIMARRSFQRLLEGENAYPVLRRMSNGYSMDLFAMTLCR